MIKSDNVPTSEPRVQRSASHSVAVTLAPIPRETVGASMQEILNTTDLRNERSFIRVHFLVSVYKARSIFMKRSSCGSHRAPIIAKATLRLHSIRLEYTT